MKGNIIAMLQNHRRVSLLRRGVAYFIDSYIIMLLCNAPILYFRSLHSSTVDISLKDFSMYESFIFVCIAISLSFLYLVVIPKKTGQTLGKKVVKIKIISLLGNELSCKQLFIRGIVGMIFIEGVLFTSSLLLQEFIARLFHVNSQLFDIYFVIVGFSILYSFLNKDQKMLHDYLAQTKIVKVN